MSTPEAGLRVPPQQILRRNLSTAQDRRSVHLLLVLPLVALLCCAVPLRYTTTMVEPDMVRMLAALVYGHATGLGIGAGQHYGLEFSFAWYALLNAVIPGEWAGSPLAVARAINLFGIASGIFCALACAVHLRQLFGTAVAATASTLFLLAPASLPLMLSAHPIVAATGCLLLGGWALNSAEFGSRATRHLWLGLALPLLVLALALRAEVAIAFPFLYFARPFDPAKPASIRQRLVRASLLTIAFGVFLWLQRGFVESSGGAASSLQTFLGTFASAGRVGRGIAVFVLALGGATAVAALLVGLSRERMRGLAICASLAVPALLFWLPNPQPARHFFLAVLGVSVWIAIALTRRIGNTHLALLAAFVVVGANQALAEVVRPLFVESYAWSYPSRIERRATQQVPLGWFHSDQAANQTNAEAERNEAEMLAKAAPERLLILADSQQYLIAYLIATDPQLRWSTRRWNGIVVNELISATRRIVLVEKYSAWPRNVTAETLANDEWRQLPVYVQPSTTSRHDVTPIPPERQFRT